MPSFLSCDDAWQRERISWEEVGGEEWFLWRMKGGERERLCASRKSFRGNLEGNQEIKVAVEGHFTLVRVEKRVLLFQKRSSDVVLGSSTSK